MKSILFGALVAFAAVQPAAAVTTVYYGQDDGVGPGGAFTNSNAAEAAFLAGAGAFGGSLNTETFESAAVGFYSPLVLNGLTVTYSTANFGAGLSGVNNTQIGGPLYGFNVTPGGTHWLGFPDFLNSAATFKLDNVSHSFGFYLTGVQDIQTSQITLKLVDGSMSTFNLPLNTNGGVTFFGITDSVGFTEVYLQQANKPGFSDAYGIDNITFGIVPEPATWALLIAGFGLVGVARRRRGIAQTAA